MGYVGSYLLMFSRDFVNCGELTSSGALLEPLDLVATDVQPTADIYRLNPAKLAPAPARYRCFVDVL
jgi:hypothetical protein